jgi:phosphoglycerol transferase MdoB-like AlkP superfamily enzyme
MKLDAAPGAPPRARSRHGFAAFCLLSLLAGWLALRVVLLCAFKPAGLAPGEAVLTLLSGFHRDLFAGVAEIIPLLCWLAVVSNRWFGARWHRLLLLGGSFVFCFTQIFLSFIEFFFFEEFKSRFNTVAVDYLDNPREVLINIWQSYHVGLFLLGCLGLTLLWMWAARRLFGGMWEVPSSGRARLLPLAAAVGLAAVLVPSLNLKGAHVCNDRTVNEVANNGVLSFFAAAWTHHLEFADFYKTMPLEEAYRRARRLMAGPEASFVAEGDSVRRRVAGDPSRPRLNVVILLEESLGSEFWGCLGRAPTLTPEMDKLAAEEGLLFTNIYACGNRTVRGMEGVLSSFPPLPGGSIVKRDLSDNVETTARVLKRDGYSTVFIYGGHGLFDSMRSYAVRNGYDRFIEQKHFAHPTFTTIWGVCDEDIFGRTIEECRELARTGKPFFATALSVSNHKPYIYPKGRIAEDPARRKREHAVKYSDFALGQFFRAARKESFWTNTVFVVVADHGARVYGKQTIPIHSYEIPVLIVGPAVVKAAGRIGQLGSSLDVSPTVLGMIGRPYQTMFFGQDLLQGRPETGRALLNHNRDIGLLAGDRLVVLGLMQTEEFYAGDPKRVDMELVSKPAETDRELEQDAIALYQVADDLYTHRLYRIDRELRPGVRLVVGALETLGAEVGIDLGGDQVGVAQEFLDAAQVCAGVQQVRGVTVPQLMRRQARVQAGDGQVLFEPKLQKARRDRDGLFGLAQKDGGVAGGRQAEQFPVALNRGQGRFANRDLALLPALATDPDKTLAPIDIVHP